MSEKKFSEFAVIIRTIIIMQAGADTLCTNIDYEAHRHVHIYKQI